MRATGTIELIKRCSTTTQCADCHEDHTHEHCLLYVRLDDKECIFGYERKLFSRVVFYINSEVPREQYINKDGTKRYGGILRAGDKVSVLYTDYDWLEENEFKSEHDLWEISLIYDNRQDEPTNSAVDGETTEKKSCVCEEPHTIDEKVLYSDGEVQIIKVSLKKKDNNPQKQE